MAELSANGPSLAAHATSLASSDVAVAPGTRMRDKDGNEYIYVTYAETLTAGQWIGLRTPSAATRVTTTYAGPIGIVTANATSTDNGWVQVYGDYATAQISNSEATSAFRLLAPTGATTEAALAASSTDDVANLVHGAWITAAASTDTTGSSSAHTGITVAVRLNYPQVHNISVNTTPGSS
jgi:hypothetical protein